MMTPNDAAATQPEPDQLWPRYHTADDLPGVEAVPLSDRGLPPTTYEALIRAALDLIAKKGPAGFTFAEAARFAGVSPAAPYRHFRDRDELLASVALRGFEQFEAALARAWDEGRPDPFAALHRLGKAYLEFARTQPAFYSAMFEAGIPAGADPPLRAASDRAFAVLRGAADKLCAAMPASWAARIAGMSWAVLVDIKATAVCRRTPKACNRLA